MYLLSHFDSIECNCLFSRALKELQSYMKKDGYYEFDKNMLKEQKNKHHMYSGGHMGLGEKRASSKWLEIESTYWMYSIINNLNIHE